MIKYNWDCKTVDVHPTEGEYSDVVYNVHWTVIGVDGDYLADTTGTQFVTSTEASAFIPFEDLTNEIIVGWTKEAMGEEQVAFIEADIAGQIEALINPTSVTMTIGD